MYKGKHFNWPETDAERVKCWNKADPVDELPPHWDDDTDLSELRYVCNTSWAHVSADKQEAYFEELEKANELGLIVDGDCGDGCIHHIYITKPETANV